MPPIRPSPCPKDRAQGTADHAGGGGAGPLRGKVLLQQRPEKGLLAGLWQPVLWEDAVLTADETLARLSALGLDCTGADPAALPRAKHIFSHIEWHQNGFSLTVPPQNAPAGCVWASREQLEAEYTLPGAFKAYKKLLLTRLL